MNNKGFTLIELVLAIALFGLLALTLSTFLLSGVNTFSSVYNSNDAQYTANILHSQIERTILSANREITWNNSNNQLIVEEYIVGTGDIYYTIDLDEANNILYYSENVGSSITPTDKMGVNVDTFKVEFVSEIVGSNTVATQAGVTVVINHDGKRFESTKVINLINEPIFNYIP